MNFRDFFLTLSLLNGFIAGCCALDARSAYRNPKLIAPKAWSERAPGRSRLAGSAGVAGNTGPCHRGNGRSHRHASDLRFCAYGFASAPRIRARLQPCGKLTKTEAGTALVCSFRQSVWDRGFGDDRSSLIDDRSSLIAESIPCGEIPRMTKSPRLQFLALALVGLWFSFFPTDCVQA
jgi:hypothetical protein